MVGLSVMASLLNCIDLEFLSQDMKRSSDDTSWGGISPNDIFANFTDVVVTSCIG